MNIIISHIRVTNIIRLVIISIEFRILSRNLPHNTATACSRWTSSPALKFLYNRSLTYVRMLLFNGRRIIRRKDDVILKHSNNNIVITHDNYIIMCIHTTYTMRCQLANVGIIRMIIFVFFMLLCYFTRTDTNNFSRRLQREKTEKKNILYINVTHSP